MKLITSVEYRTRWGEELFLRKNGSLIPMKYCPGDVWRAEIDGLEAGQKVEYRYELHVGGLCRRCEWKSHAVTLPETVSEGAVAGQASENAAETVTVTDSWNDVPCELPLHSAPFADGVFSREPGRKWKAAGTAIPVFSLRSETSFGVGDFHDLKLMADWAALTGQKIIQLLPVNDTTMTGTPDDSYPYSANSSFALHPQFLYLPEAGVEENEEYVRLRSELNALPTVDYVRVNSEKHRLLRETFDKVRSKVLRTKAYKAFVAENAQWLLPYAVFCVLRDEFGTADFTKWKKENTDFSVYDDALAADYAARHRKETDYYCFLQYHLDRQLSEARDYARAKGVIFKGDLPIGVSRTSADAWVNRKLFNLDSSAGAPPDAFSADGQNWKDLPTYNWDEMSKDNYAWWRSRLRTMARYFDAFRIDHLLGFFRIWEIPICEDSGIMGHFSPALPYSSDELRNMGFELPVSGQGSPVRDSRPGDVSDRNACPGNQDVLFVEDPRRKGWWHPRIASRSTSAYARLNDWMKSVYDRLYDDFFYRRHNAFWKESAMKKLSVLLSETGMLVCGEDLGMIPACVPEVMSEYQILSLEIQRMPKADWQTFADPAQYPYYSVCTTSTHDMNPIRAWWNEDRQLTNRFWHEVLWGGGEAPQDCTPEICDRIVRMHLDSPAMLTVLPLQDWLSVDGDLRFDDPSQERINVPSIPRYYWRYRMHLTLENLISQTGFNSRLKTMIEASGRL